MNKRIVLVAFWIILLMLAPATPALAYLDPATTTYLIQVTTAIIITLGVSLSIFFYRFQMIVTNIRVSFHVLAQKLGRRRKSEAVSSGLHEEGLVGTSLQTPGQFDVENALTTGAIDYRFSVRDTYPGLVTSAAAAGQAAQDASTEATIVSEADMPPAKKPSFAKRLKFFGHRIWSDTRGFKHRLKKALLLAAALTMNYGLFNMIDSIIMNQSELIFSFADAIGPVLVFVLALFVVLLLFFICFRGKVFDFWICLMLTFLIGGYIQSTFLNKGLGQLMGQPLGWLDLGIPVVLFNLLIWVVIGVVVFKLGLTRKPKRQSIFKRFFLFVPILIIAVQFVALFSILPPVHEWSAKKSGTVPVLSREDIYDVSSKSNIFIFVLDTMEDSYVNLVVNQSPDFFDELDGFTRYINCISVYNLTYPSIVNLLTGEIVDNTIPTNDFIWNAYTQSAFIPELQDMGYVTNLYMEKPYAYRDDKQLEGLAYNLKDSVYSLDEFGISWQLFRLSLLKNSPLSLKFAFWLYSDILSYSYIGIYESGAEPFWSDDPRFYRDLVDQGLNVTDEPHFVFYHLFGYHPPYTMNSKAEYVEGGVDWMEQYKGSFFMLYEFFDQLKELGLYKDATIIIVGDHPGHPGSRAPSKATLIGCFVKPAGAEGTPLRISKAPVSLANVRATCIEAAGGDPTPWGRTFFEIAEDDTSVRDYYYRFTEENGTHKIAHFQIVGDARKWENWELVEIIIVESRYWF